MMQRVLLMVILLWTGRFAGVAQYYLGGQDPASVHWMQLKTPVARIIFPEEARLEAQRYAHLLLLTHRAVDSPYVSRVRTLPVVLHNRRTLSNAMVSPTPYHADFFLMPDQVSYAQRWSKQLSLHEYRHAVQMQSMHRGVGGVLYGILGDQAIGAMMGLFMPFWFIEGDAVLSETLYSSSGRGRWPDFSHDLRAQLLDKGIYSYDKAQYGSYRDQVPDHYTLGYQLVLAGNLHYPSLWTATLEKVARRPYSLMPFGNSLRQFTGKGKPGYYREVMESLTQSWQEENAHKQPPVMLPQPQSTDFCSYRFAVPLSDGSVVVEKISLGNLNQLIRIDTDGKETHLVYTGYDFQQSLSGNDSLLVWNVRTFDPRWSNRDYSDVMIYNHVTHKLRQLTRHQRLFAPSLSHDGTKIAAVGVGLQNQYTLTIIDAASGQLLNSMALPDNWFIQTPSWGTDDQNVVMVAVGDKGQAIAMADLSSGAIRLPVPFDFADKAQPVLRGNILVYKSGRNGTADLYMLDITTAHKRQLTLVPYGVADPVWRPDAEELVFSNYTADGYRLAVTDLYSAPDIPSAQAPYPWLVDSLVNEHTFNLDRCDISDSTYPVKRYRRMAHLLHLHSWGPTVVSADNYSFEPGIQVMSQNMLSTMTATAGYYYDENEGSGVLKAGVQYLGWYPAWSMNVSSGKRAYSYSDSLGITHDLHWRETTLSTAVSIPLNFSRGRVVSGIEPSAGVEQLWLRMLTDAQVEFTEDTYTVVQLGINGWIQSRRSLRDIFPRYGVQLWMGWRRTPWSASPSQQQWLGLVTYLPGLAPHHGVRLFAGVQSVQNGYYDFSNALPVSRGYSGIYLQNMLVTRFGYTLPLAYPDWDIPSFLYVKRIRALAFVDLTMGDAYKGGFEQYNSTGAELMTDTHWFGLLPEVSLGVRGSFRFNDQRWAGQLLFGMSF